MLGVVRFWVREPAVHRGVIGGSVGMLEVETWLPIRHFHRRRPGWPGLWRKEDQLQMEKHGARDIRIGQEGDDAHLAAALLADQHVDLKVPLQKRRPVKPPLAWENGKRIAEAPVDLPQPPTVGTKKILIRHHNQCVAGKLATDVVATRIDRLQKPELDASRIIVRYERSYYVLVVEASSPARSAQRDPLSADRSRLLLRGFGTLGRPAPDRRGAQVARESRAACRSIRLVPGPRERSIGIRFESPQRLDERHRVLAIGLAEQVGVLVQLRDLLAGRATQPALLLFDALVDVRSQILVLLRRDELCPEQREQHVERSAIRLELRTRSREPEVLFAVNRFVDEHEECAYDICDVVRVGDLEAERDRVGERVVLTPQRLAELRRVALDRDRGRRCFDVEAPLEVLDGIEGCLLALL